MKEQILNLLNENKRNVFFVRIPLEITDKFLSLVIESQNENILDFIPRKYIAVIEIEGEFYKLDPFNFIKISENVFEFKKQVTEYYPDNDSYRFFFDEEEKGIYMDFDDLNGWKQYCSDSRKNLKEELWDVEEDE